MIPAFLQDMSVLEFKASRVGFKVWKRSKTTSLSGPVQMGGIILHMPRQLFRGAGRFRFAIQGGSYMDREIPLLITQICLPSGCEIKCTTTDIRRQWLAMRTGSLESDSFRSWAKTDKTAPH
jgi:hypothetical protein